MESLKHSGKFSTRFARTLLGALLVVESICAQQTEDAPHSSPNSSKGMVLVSVVVLDRNGKPLSGLGPDSFTIIDNDIQQSVLELSERNGPAALGIVLDTSLSLRPVLREAESAVRNFLNLANPDNQAFLYTTATNGHASTELKGRAGTLRTNMSAPAATGKTALLDTIYRALEVMCAFGDERKALLLISDGLDNNSHHSVRDLMSLVRRSDVQIFAIAIDQRRAFDKTILSEQKSRGIWRLDEIAESGGGFSVPVRDAEAINAAVVKISDAIRAGYVLGYTPQQAALRGTWHSIQVRVGVPGSKVHARPGYFTP
ncbi:MAG TPA: VWA domain-containing protein [Bryobacteraceae bacterium]|jgi:Ca-activated chloride channel family protein|nr:VWA domain-containing protein [Bryobacteraceae bacterium]